MSISAVRCIRHGADGDTEGNSFQKWSEFIIFGNREIKKSQNDCYWGEFFFQCVR